MICTSNYVKRLKVKVSLRKPKTYMSNHQGNKSWNAKDQGADQKAELNRMKGLEKKARDTPNQGQEAMIIDQTEKESTNHNQRGLFL